jgi:hypothetical protein
VDSFFCSWYYSSSLLLLFVVVVVVVVVVARKRARKYYSNNSRNPHVIDMICEKRVFKSFLRFFGRVDEKKSKREDSRVFIRKLSFCSSFLSRVKNTSNRRQGEECCFFQKTVSQALLLSKKCLHSCRYDKKQSSLCSSSALCAETLFRLHSLRALSLHFEEAFVVVVSEED